MADKKISQLTGATTPVAGTEVLPIVQGGNTVKVSIANLTAGRGVAASALDVSGTAGEIVSINSTAANGPYVTISRSGTVYGDVGIAAQVVSGGATTDFGVNARGANNLILGSNAVERVRINATGVGIGVSPTYRLDVAESGAPTATNSFSMARIAGGDAVANDLTLLGPSTSQVRIKFGDQDSASVGEVGYDNATDSMQLVTNGVSRLTISSSGVTVINDGGLDSDLRVEGDTDANLLFTDASTDRVGLGTNTPNQKLEVVGNLRLSGAQVGSKIESRQNAISVSTATTILDDAGAYGRLVIVNGSDSNVNRFCDLVLASSGDAPTVVSSFTAIGSPAARTYTRSGAALQLAMASGTYDVFALALGF